MNREEILILVNSCKNILGSYDHLAKYLGVNIRNIYRWKLGIVPTKNSRIKMYNLIKERSNNGYLEG